MKVKFAYDLGRQLAKNVLAKHGTAGSVNMPAGVGAGPSSLPASSVIGGTTAPSGPPSTMNGPAAVPPPPFSTQAVGGQFSNPGMNPSLFGTANNTNQLLQQGLMNPNVGQ